MWEHTAIFQDWKAISGLLLSDELSEDSQTLLAQLLNVAVQHAVGVEVCPRTSPGKSKESKRKKEAREKDAEQSRTQLTRQLAKDVPRLFSKFKANAAIIEELAQIPQYFDLQIYKSDRLKPEFSSLLESLSTAFLSHSSDGILSACTKTWQHLMKRASDAGSSKETMGHFKSLEESLLDSLEDIGIPHTKEDMMKHPLTDDQEERLRATLMRIYHISTIHDVSHLPIYDGVLELLDAYATYTITEPETAQVEISVLYNYLLWQLSHAKQSLQAHTADVGQGHIEDVVSNRKNLQLALSKLFADPKSTLDADVQLKAFEVFCDISIAFKHDEDAVAVTTSAINEDTAEAIKDYFSAQMKLEAPDVEDEDILQNFEGDKCRVVTALAKAVAYGGLPKSLAPLILVEFHRQGKRCAKVISYFLARIREFDTFTSSRSADIILEALKNLFSVYEIAEDEDDEATAFEEFKKFTMKLALTFGVGVERSRSTVIIVIEEGIRYALEKDKRYMFFNALNRFLSNLRSDLIPDLEHIKNKLDAVVNDPQVGSQPDEDNLEHAPYFTFMEHLERLCSPDSTSSRKRRPTEVVEADGKGDDEEEEREEEEEKEASEISVTPAKRRKSTRGRRRSGRG